MPDRADYTVSGKIDVVIKDSGDEPLRVHIPFQGIDSDDVKSVFAMLLDDLVQHAVADHVEEEE